MSENTEVGHVKDCSCDSCRLRRIEEKMEKVETLVTKIVDEVKPTIDELMQSSLFKMLGMKKGK